MNQDSSRIIRPQASVQNIDSSRKSREDIIDAIFGRIFRRNLDDGIGRRGRVGEIDPSAGSGRYSRREEESVNGRVIRTVQTLGHGRYQRVGFDVPPPPPPPPPIEEPTEQELYDQYFGMFDLNGDGEISDEELVLALLRVRQGEFSSDHLGVIHAALNTNENYDRIQGLVGLFDKVIDGEIGELELFDALFQIKRGTYPELIDDLQHVINTLVAQNANGSNIRKFVDALDPVANEDGYVSYEELIDAFLKVSSGEVYTPSVELMENIPDMTAADYGEVGVQAFGLINGFDANKSGDIDNTEIAMMLLLDRKDDHFSQFDSNLVAAALAKNANSGKLAELINLIDSDEDGELSDTEMINAILAKSRPVSEGGLDPNDHALIDDILNIHPDYAIIDDVVAKIDDDGDGIISDTNVAMSLLKYKIPNISGTMISRQVLNQRAMEIYNQAIAINPSAGALETALDSLAGVHEGNLIKMLNTLLEVRDTDDVNSPYYILLDPLKALLDEWAANRDADIAARLTTMINDVQSRADNNQNTIDTAVDSNEAVQEALEEVRRLEELIKDLELDIADIDSQLAPPPTKVVEVYKETTGETIQQTVVDDDEVNRLNGLKDVAEEDLEQARLDVIDAREAADEAIENALNLLDITDQLRGDMDNLLNLVSNTLSDKRAGKADAYNTVEDLFVAYSDFVPLLPSGSEAIISQIFFNDFLTGLNDLRGEF